MCAFSTCRICGRTGLAVCRAINVGCSCPISDLSVRQSQRPPPPPLWPCPGRAHEPPSAQVQQQQQQASAYSVRNGVERVPTLDPHANPVSEIHRPAGRRTPRAGSSRNPGRHHLGTVGGIIPESPGGFAGIRCRVRSVLAEQSRLSAGACGIHWRVFLSRRSSRDLISRRGARGARAR